MRVDGVTVERNNLILHTTRTEAVKAAYAFKKPGEYALREIRRRRSLDSNALLWSLCEQIAIAVGATKEDVYRVHIRQYGVNTALTARYEAAEAFIAAWSSRGLGFFCERVDDAKSGAVTIIAYHGSSTYDSRQMSRLLESVIEEAKELDIETPEERQLGEYIKNWEAKEKKQSK